MSISTLRQQLIKRKVDITNVVEKGELVEKALEWLVFLLFILINFLFYKISYNLVFYQKIIIMYTKNNYIFLHSVNSGSKSTKYNLLSNIVHDSPQGKGKEGSMDPLTGGTYRVHVKHKSTDRYDSPFIYFIPGFYLTKTLTSDSF